MSTYEFFISTALVGLFYKTFYEIRHMTSKAELCRELTRLTGADPPFTPTSPSYVPKNFIAEAVDLMRDYRRPDDFEPVGERPGVQPRRSESQTQYRARMADYIEQNTGLRLPVTSAVSWTFYERLADALRL